MKSNVTVILLNWNSWKDTIECLESLYQINYPNYNVILVDNNSLDDSLNKIKEYCNGKIEITSDFFEYNPDNKPIEVIEYTEKEIENMTINNDEIKTQIPNKQLIIIKNNKNHGFAEGNNIAIRYTFKALNTDHILLLNNDTVVDENFLDELVEVAESSHEIGAVGPKTYFYNEKNKIQWAAGGLMEPEYFKFKFMGFCEIDNNQYNKNQELDFITGSCVLCKREVIKKTGLLDHSYFMYFEDLDWSLRIIKNDYKCIYAYKSKIWHKWGVSSSDCFKTHYQYMNRIYLIKKNFKKNEYLKSLVKFIFTIFPYESLYFIRSKGIKHYFCYLRGIINGIKK